MRRILLASVAAIVLAGPACGQGLQFGQLPSKAIVLFGQNADGTYSAVKLDVSGNVLTSGSGGGGSTSGFTPSGAPVNLNATTTSASASLPATADIVVTNNGATDVKFRLTAGASTAVTTDQTLKAGAAAGFHLTTQTVISAITASGSSTLDIQGGAGLVAGYGGGSSSSGGNVNQTGINGVTPLVGAGATGTGSPRTTQAQDTSTVAGASPTTTGLYVTGAAAAALATAAAQATGNTSLSSVDTKLTTTNTNTGNTATSAASIDTKLSTTNTNTGTAATGIGAPGDTACATDTGTCDLIQQLKLGLQKLTSALTKLDTLHTDAIAALPPQGSHSVNIGGVEGTTASGVALTDSPLADGCRAATASPTAVTDGQKVNKLCDSLGKTVNSPYSIKENYLSGGASSTDTSAHTLIAAQGASVKIYMTDALCYRTDVGTTAIEGNFNDGATTGFAIPAGGEFKFQWNIPLVVAANTALQYTMVNNVTTVKCYATAFKGP